MVNAFEDYLSAGVTDGVTVKHTCCSVEGNCMIPLLSPRDRFCAVHWYKKSECFVDSCRSPVISGHFACEDPSHRAREEEMVARSHKGLYELRRRLRKAGVPMIPLAGQGEGHCTPLGASSATDPDTPQPAEPQASSTTPSLRGRITRKYTHNEQLFVRCCGVILSRATFYHAEGIASVKVRMHYTGSVVFH